MQKGQKNYLVFNVTEHVHLYCNSLKSISVLNLCVFAVYIFYRKTWFFGVIFFCHIFSGKNFLQFICTMFIIKHRMFLYTLFVSFSNGICDLAFNFTGPWCHETNGTCFFILAFALPWLTQQMQVQNASHDSVFTLAFAFGFECVDVVHACIFLILHLCVNQA